MTDKSTPKIGVEVAYATPLKQKIIALKVEAGSTAYEAARLSRIAAEFEGVDIESVKMGIFGKAVKPREYVLKAGERVEIYRPLVADPKVTRKARAQKARHSASPDPS